jgi:hypothetical protein
MWWAIASIAAAVTVLLLALPFVEAKIVGAILGFLVLGSLITQTETHFQQNSDGSLTEYRCLWDSCQAKRSNIKFRQHQKETTDGR